MKYKKSMDQTWLPPGRAVIMWQEDVETNHIFWRVSPLSFHVVHRGGGILSNMEKNEDVLYVHLKINNLP